MNLFFRLFLNQQFVGHIFDFCFNILLYCVLFFQDHIFFVFLLFGHQTVVKVNALSILASLTSYSMPLPDFALSFPVYFFFLESVIRF